MIGHLGSRVTALLDGRLDVAEEERVWEHVHTCHPCRDAVEREGWVKTQLVQWAAVSAPDTGSLRDSLLARRPELGAAADDASPMVRSRYVMALGGSALGVAVLGVLAIGSVPANAPLPDRRTASTSIVPPSASPSQGPTVASTAGLGTTRSVSRTVAVRVPVRHGSMVP